MFLLEIAYRVLAEEIGGLLEFYLMISNFFIYND
jgi:hypothetical protein